MKYHSTQPIYIFNKENPQNTSQNGPRIFAFVQHKKLVGLKFGLSEKHTKFEKNIPHGCDKSADVLGKRQNHEEDFFKL